MESTLTRNGWLDQLDLQDRALASTSEGITISDARLPDLPIIYANAGFERLTGYRAQDIIGRNCRFLQGPGTDPATVAMISHAIGEEREISVEILNYRRDGTQFWNRLSITPVRDEMGQVSHFIGVQSDITARKQAEESLQRTTQELVKKTARMKQNLQAAARIQQAWLPSEMPAVNGVKFSWAFHPCDELAGDSLNVFHLDENHLGMYVLDVSGHGVPAALLSVTLNRWLIPIPGQSCLFTRKSSPRDATAAQLISARESSPQGVNDHVYHNHHVPYEVTPPAQVLEELNRQFPLDPETGQYFTIVYGILDIRNHTFRYANAGHPPPILLTRDDAQICPPEGSFPIGFVPTPNYVEQELQVRPGSRLFFYSDGIVEAVNDLDQEFGSEQLLAELVKRNHLPVKTNLDEVMSLVRDWSQMNRLEDDVSFLALEIDSPPNEV